jgi:hypothetical protein
VPPFALSPTSFVTCKDVFTYGGGNIAYSNLLNAWTLAGINGPAGAVPPLVKLSAQDFGQGAPMTMRVLPNQVGMTMDSTQWPGGVQVLSFTVAVRFAAPFDFQGTIFRAQRGDPNCFVSGTLNNHMFCTGYEHFEMIISSLPLVSSTSSDGQEGWNVTVVHRSCPIELVSGYGGWHWTGSDACADSGMSFSVSPVTDWQHAALVFDAQSESTVSIFYGGSLYATYQNAFTNFADGQQRQGCVNGGCDSTNNDPAHFTFFDNTAGDAPFEVLVDYVQLAPSAAIIPFDILKLAQDGTCPPAPPPSPPSSSDKLNKISRERT